VFYFQTTLVSVAGTNLCLAMRVHVIV